MNNEKLPPCVCYAHNWRQGSSQMGGVLFVDHHTCNHCGRYGTLLGYKGLWAFFIRDKAAEDACMDYVNNLFMLQGDIYAESVEPIRTRYEEFLSAELLKQFGVDPTQIQGGLHYEPKREGNQYEPQYVDGQNVPIPGLDHKAFRAAHNQMFDAVGNVQASALLTPSFLINIPREIDVKLHCDLDFCQNAPTRMGSEEDLFRSLMAGERPKLFWKYQPHITSEIPKSPTLIAHENFYDGVLKEVSEATKVQILAEAVDNQYSHEGYHGKNTPWYAFYVGLTKITVGPRKRVFHIGLEMPDARDVSSIRDIALKDEVTYTADGGYKSGDALAKTVLVHAWGREKLVEYLTLIVNIAQNFKSIPRR